MVYVPRFSDPATVDRLSRMQWECDHYGRSNKGERVWHEDAGTAVVVDGAGRPPERGSRRCYGLDRAIT